MKFCLIGEKLSHSFSRELHQACGLDYDLVSLPKERLESFFIKCDYDGFNVTIPYKKEVLRFLDFVDENARITGSVNTVVKKQGRYYGYNTDGFGLDYALKKAKISLSNKNVVILGSGGTSLSAEVVCKKYGAKSITVVSRNGKINYENVYGLTQTQVVINCTPVGMEGRVNESLLDLCRFSKIESLFDCIYNPLNTNLIIQGKSMGLKCANGLTMLVAQGLKSQQVWLDNQFDYEREIDCKKQEKIEKTLLNKNENIVLIGMPSCGKSVIGKTLGEQLKKEFYDVDLEIEKRECKSVESIILEKGENAFRNIEKLVVENLSKKKGVIIATGGGSVLEEDNRINLKRNGKIFYVQRNLDKLIVDFRPISKEKGVEKIYNERKAIYEKYCDFKVENNHNLEYVIEKIKENI